MQRDPVCGVTIAEKTAAGTADYQRARDYFCSEACRRKFAANSVEFIK
jgi:YHS domain-containing protein